MSFLWRETHLYFQHMYVINEYTLYMIGVKDSISFGWIDTLSKTKQNNNQKKFREKSHFSTSQ